MGQKINPTGFRLAVSRNWSSRWFASGPEFARKLGEDLRVREFLRKKRLVKPKDQKQTARIFRQLARGGFGTRTIFAILKKWDVDEETLSALEGETA